MKPKTPYLPLRALFVPYQIFPANPVRLDFIVTRNQRDFHHSPIPAVSSEKLLEMLK